MKFARTIFLVTSLVGMGAVLTGSYTHLKALLAQQLLAQAWSNGLSQNQASKPWPWADTRAVARLSLDKQNISMIVLDGISGESMAFGPGLAINRLNDQNSAYLIGGHRDTHMGFLKNVKNGDEINLELVDGSHQTYVVKQQLITNVETEQLTIDPTSQALILVTCYPFDAIAAGGPLRFVTIASPRTLPPNGTTLEL